jgi:hypothetical protein
MTRKMVSKADLFTLLASEFQKAVDAAASEDEQVRPRVKVFFAQTSIKSPLELLKDPYIPEKLRRRLNVTPTDETDFFVMGFKYRPTKTANFYIVMNHSIWAIYTLAPRWLILRSLNRIFFHSPLVSSVWLPPSALEKLAETFGGRKRIYGFTSKFSPFTEDPEQGIGELTVKLWGKKAYSHMLNFEEQYDAKPSRIAFDIISSNPGNAKIAVSSDGYVLLDSGELSAFAAVANSYDGIVTEITKQLGQRGAEMKEVRMGESPNVEFHMGRPLLVNLSKPLNAQRLQTLKDMFTKADSRTRFAGYVDQEEDGFISVNAVDLANRDGLVNIRNIDEKTLVISLFEHDNPRTLQRVFRLLALYFDPDATSEISSIISE